MEAILPERKEDEAKTIPELPISQAQGQTDVQPPPPLVSEADLKSDLKGTIQRLQQTLGDNQQQCVATTNTDLDSLLSLVDTDLQSMIQQEMAAKTPFEVFEYWRYAYTPLQANALLQLTPPAARLSSCLIFLKRVQTLYNAQKDIMEVKDIVRRVLIKVPGGRRIIKQAIHSTTSRSVLGISTPSATKECSNWTVQR